MKKSDMFIILLLLIVLVLITIDIVNIKRDGGKCMRNPASFMMEKLSGYFDKNIECICNNQMTINKTGMFRMIGGEYD